MISHQLVAASIFIACCLKAFADAATLGSDEVDALRSIGRTLGKDWDFSVDPCSGTSGWQDPPVSDYVNDVTCDCSFNNSNTCHVTRILLRAQNLSGILPADLISLPFLQEIDLSRNFLSGNIPPQWGSASRLANITLLGNRLTGEIPVELQNLSNLTNLVLEVNGFSGPLPPELGNLPGLKRMMVSSNNFTGEIPETYANLTYMEDFRISDNHFTGQIPEFIFRDWRNLTQIEMEGSGLSGPIPSFNAPLQSLRYIIISDLNGAEAAFPQLNASLPRLDQVWFRSCNLIGEIPSSLREFPTIRILDLSFNRLRGEIPDLSGFNFDILFLNGNNFTGTVPSWILETNDDVDVSYNNFTSTPGESGCGRPGLNLFSSISRTNNSVIVPCLRSLNCPARSLHSVYINCGGRNITVNGIDYEADLDQAGRSAFYQGTNWVVSSTGVFLNDDRNDILGFTSTQLSINGGDARYTDARVSPSSLTYYTFCLANANYTVDLHFAEIQFTNDQTYSSLGKRMFDIYIQGQRVLKDFNIKERAGGAGIPRVETFPANVTDSTLEIHFRWAGKGTTSIPRTGVYGPLISAISIFDPAYIDTLERDSGITTAAVVGIVAGVMLAALLIVGILWWTGCLRRKSTLERDLKGIELQTNSFSLRQIKAATNDFHASNKIGEGGFGPVYKGILADGTVIAVKQLSARSKQGNREFVTELGMISALQHPHLVKLYGCCIEGNQLMLIYEYLENNCLARALFGPPEFQLKLDWATRRKICIGIARGLVYLHEESRLKIVHRDIKATNVLLDKNLIPKISDFGLAKLHEEDNTHISTRIAGTYGYMAPEYAMHGRLTEKADVYSFGIVALEIVRGRCNTSNRLMEDPFYLLDYAHVLKEKGNLLDLVDTRIGSDCNVDEVTTMINIGLLCTNPIASARPTMSSVVSMLEGKTSVEEFFTDSSVCSSRQMDAETVKKLYQKLEEDDADVSETKSLR